MDTTPEKSERRSGNERRNLPKRRRHAETRMLNIELCHSVLRVALVVDDQRSDLPTITTETIRWKNDAPDLKCDQGLAELSAALKEYVNRNRLTGCQVSFALSSTLCVNRAMTGPSTKVEQEISTYEERSQQYLALGSGVKTTAVGRKQIDARHVHALVTVTNGETLKLLVQAAEAAGLVVNVVESALVALSRLHGYLEPENSGPTLLAQLDEQRFEIGVSRNGQLLNEYRPASDVTLKDLGATIDDHHSRFEKFCHRQYGLGEMEISRVWLVGEPDEIAATNAKTKTPLETGVLPLDLISKYWEHENLGQLTAEMGAALGLALRGRSDDTGVSPNLMDQIHAQAKTPIRPFLTKALSAIAATLLVAGSLWAFNLEQEFEIASLRAEVEEIRPLELRGSQLSKRLRHDSIEIEQLLGLSSRVPATRINPLIARVGECLPDDVWLKRLHILGNSKASVIGASYTESGMYDFVHHLEKSPRLNDVALLGTGTDHTSQGPATQFEINLKLAPLPGEEKHNE